MSELSKIANGVLSKYAKFVNEQMQKPFQLLSVPVAEADPEAEAARHVLGLRPTRPRARAAFNPASVRL